VLRALRPSLLVGRRKPLLTNGSLPPISHSTFLTAPRYRVTWIEAFPARKVSRWAEVQP
jgi:hypothetical protein